MNTVIRTLAAAVSLSCESGTTTCEPHAAIGACSTVDVCCSDTSCEYWADGADRTFTNFPCNGFDCASAADALNAYCAD